MLAIACFILNRKEGNIGLFFYTSPQSFIKRLLIRWLNNIQGLIIDDCGCKSIYSPLSYPFRYLYNKCLIMTSRYYSQDKSLIFKIKTFLAEVKIFFLAVNLELCKAIPYFPTFLIKKFYALPQKTYA